MHELRKLEYFCLAYACEVYHTKRNGYQITGNNTNQDGSQLQDSLTKMVQCSYNCQSEECHQPVLPGAIIRVACAASHIVDRCRIQGQSDGKYNRTSDQRREEHSDLTDQYTHDKGYNTTNNLCTKDCRDSIAFCDRLHTWNVGKADTHDHRKSGSKCESTLLANRKQLDQC